MTGPGPATPRGARHRIAGWWHHYTRRPWEFLQASIMAFTGLVDLLGARPFPPEIDNYAPAIVWRLYGLYLATGSIMVGWAILVGASTGYARRLERTGLLLVAGACGVGTALFTYWLYAHAGPEDEVSIVVTGYLTILLILTTFGSMARWWFLGSVTAGRRDG